MPIFRPLASLVWVENEVMDGRMRDVMAFSRDPHTKKMAQTIKIF